MSPLKILLIIFGVIVLILLYDGIRAALLLKKTSELMAASRPYEQSPQNPTSKIIFVGDSTAVGTGASRPEDSVAGRFGALYPDATIINQGINGQKIHELEESFDPAKEGRADLLIIQIGGNDILKFTPTQSVQNDLNLLLKKAFLVSNKVVIIHSGNVGLAPFFPRYLGFIWTWQTLKIRSIYMNAASSTGATYVDLFKDRKDDIFSQDPTKYYAADFVHPSSDGYKVWFDSILSALHARYGESII